jgi:hypothetical protein
MYVASRWKVSGVESEEVSVFLGAGIHWEQYWNSMTPEQPMNTSKPRLKARLRRGSPLSNKPSRVISMSRAMMAYSFLIPFPMRMLLLIASKHSWNSFKSNIFSYINHVSIPMGGINKASLNSALPTPHHDPKRHSKRDGIIYRICDY